MDCCLPCSTSWKVNNKNGNMAPGAPLTHFNDGEGGVRVIFFGFEILAQSDFSGSMKDARIFLGRKKKKNRDFFGL